MSTTPLKRSFFFNLISPIMRLVVAVVTVPIYIHHVGEARYGVLSIVWILLGYFGFLDLGLSRASTNALSKLRDAPQPDRARVLLTTITLNFCFGIVGSFLLYFVGGYLFQHVLSVPDALKPEVEGALPWIACLFPMAMVSGAAMGALESRERFLTANLFQMFSMILSQVAPVIMAVFVGPSLEIVIPTVAIVQIISIVVQLTFIYRLEGPISLKAFDRAEARKLLGYGGWVTVSSVVSPFLVSADQFLIGSLIGVAGVAHYAVPMNLVVRTQIVPAALARTFFPRMSILSRDAAHELAARALQSLGYGYAAICAPAIIISPVFFRYWIGVDFAQIAAPVAQILFIGAWINGLAFVSFTLIQGQGRPDLTGKLHFIEILPFLGILWLLTSTFGITGAATAWSLRSAVDAFAMFWAAGMSRKVVIAAIARPAALLFASEAVAQFVGINLVPAFAAAALVGLVAAWMAYFYCEDWRRLAGPHLRRARGVLEAVIRRARPAPSA
jgi:O-antigen/teichoic acid export membrane protein